MSAQASVDGSVTSLPNFEGWYFHPDGTIEPLTCPMGSFVTSGAYATCCNQSKCAMATGCHDNKISYDNFAVGACQGGASCQTMSILPAPGADGPVTSSIFCAQVWYALQAFRDTVPVTTATSTKTTKTTGSSSPTASSGSSPTNSSPTMTTTPSTTTATTPHGTSTSSPGSSNTPAPAGGASSSKAWIAGAVVGPVAALALVGVGLWLFRRNAQRKKKNQNANMPQEIGGHERRGDYNGMDGNWQSKHYYGAQQPKNEPAEADYYAPVQQNQLHELPSGGETR